MKRINLLALVIALTCVVGIFGMVNGKIQTVVGFDDPLNEIVFTVLLFMGAIGAVMNIKKYFKNK